MTVLALKRKHYDLATAIPFVAMHVAALLVFVVPFKPSLVAWFIGSYYLRMFGVTGGYHRYFSHRAFKLNRFWQFCMAFLAQTSGQKGVLWWAAHHRDHHLNSDRKEDLHSPVHEGFWWSHLGLLNRVHLLPFVLYGAAIWLVGGFDAFVWGFLLATVFLYHGTFLINSLSHIWGTRRFATPDESRNNFALALVTLGEGWHNNHHYFMSSVRQGIRWWEIDGTYYVLRALSWIGITRDLREFKVIESEDESAA
jgi:stearoyl-CoA desaturase (delta-9 desaturase)